eukprot:COSAG01_NODE_1304_length_10809_cov_2.635387_6_plen_251_part_00
MLLATLLCCLQVRPIQPCCRLDADAAAAGGPGIIVFGAMGVEITSNYYEANCEPCHAGRWCDDRFKKLHPALDNHTAPVIDLNTDIVLTGGASFHGGNSDYKHWGPIEFVSPATCCLAPRLRAYNIIYRCVFHVALMLSQAYGRAFPPQSVLISGNTHAPSPNGSAVLAICGDGIILEANEFGSRTRSAASTNVALVETCSDASLCGVYNMFTTSARHISTRTGILSRLRFTVAYVFESRSASLCAGAGF